MLGSEVATRRCMPSPTFWYCCCNRRWADDLQWEKAGLLEVADVIAIHKADLPEGATRVEAQVLATLGLSMAPAPPVLRVSARTGQGVAELWAAIRVLPLLVVERSQQRWTLTAAVGTGAVGGAFRVGGSASGGEATDRKLARWRNGTLP